jgi:hypothetical protein
MSRLKIFTVCLMILALGAACAPIPAEDVADVLEPGSTENSDSVEKIPPTEVDAPDFAQELMAALAKELKVDVSEITLVSSEKMEWRDSCMGVERKGMMCLEVITPGYLIVFETPMGIYEAHTNEDGTAFLFVPQEASTTETPSTSTDS